VLNDGTPDEVVIGTSKELTEDINITVGASEDKEVFGKVDIKF